MKDLHFSIKVAIFLWNSTKYAREYNTNKKT